MYNLAEELVFLLLQYFDEKAFRETAHTLERESGLYFDLKHFEQLVLEGKWDEADNYLSGFTKVEDNSHSIKIYFEMRKQKYLEALDSNDQCKALGILVKDLKVFAPINEKLYRDLTQLLTINNIRECKSLSTYQDANSARKKVMDEIKRIIEQHPLLEGKLKFPAIKSHRLQHLLNERINRQQQNPVPGPAPEHEIFMRHVFHSKPSTSAPTNPETTLKVREDPNEIFKGRSCVVSDKSDCKNVLEEEIPDSIEKSRKSSKNLYEICKPSQCRFLLLLKHSEVNKIVRLSYTHAGHAILALASNGTHLLWLWQRSSRNLDGKATTQVCPQLWEPGNGAKFMSNDLTSATNCEDLVSSFAISKKDSYVMSTSGGMVSLFNLLTFKTLVTTNMPSPSMVTCLAFYPEDNNILVVGLDDSSILIYHIHKEQVQIKLEGHSKRVTALAFSNTLNVLVSGDANAQIVVWSINRSIDKGEKLRDRNLHIHGQKVPDALPETQIQFHPDQQHFLVVHNSHLAIYEATELKCVNQWDPKVSVVISQATFSSDGHTVYASFVDGTLAIFGSSDFQMHCRIHPSAYLSSTSSMSIYPTAIAAHPQKPTQFAVGLTDGSVCVFEPQEPHGNWIMPPIQVAVDDKEPTNTRVEGFKPKKSNV